MIRKFMAGAVVAVGLTSIGAGVAQADVAVGLFSVVPGTASAQGLPACGNGVLQPGVCCVEPDGSVNCHDK